MSKFNSVREYDKGLILIIIKEAYDLNRLEDRALRQS